mmetsp:Transcript_5218/g.11823  ORF Transcript_5218/g.11823 Transcript_5218/m.11823 type:complete len:103 (-) Transcript_5218:250-558(-)
MAAFTNSAISIKVLTPAAKGAEGKYYWGMVNEPGTKDLFKVSASASTTLGELKEAVAKERSGYPVKMQRFMLFGAEVADDRTLSSCGFENTDDPVLHMIPRV